MKSMQSVELVSIRVENLRGYRDATLELKDLVLLVGENNQGKSSILKMLDLLINGFSFDFWNGTRRLTESDLSFWMPANTTVKRARRFTFVIRFCDGRVARRFNCGRDEEIQLRFGIMKKEEKARLNVGPPKRGERHDSLAQELLTKLKESMHLIYINPIRDAQSSSYTVSLLEEVRESLRNSVIHKGPGGTTRDYRELKSLVKSVSEVVSRHSERLNISDETLLSRMLRDSEVRFTASTDQLLTWILENIGVVLCTGDHDELMVNPTEVGNGLQSLIDLSLSVARARKVTSKGVTVLIIIEEPEAFLHPSAQRELMISIREHTNDASVRVVMTTHSPIIIDESLFPEVSLVRNHSVFQPKTTSIERDSINTALMGTENSETFFSDSILLVEGPSDRAFFDSVLRRLRKENPGEPKLTRIHVQSVGGKSGFVPWIKLLNSYSKAHDIPIEYLCLADYDALLREGGSSSIERTLHEVGENIPAEIGASITEFNTLAHDQEGDVDKRSACVKTINKFLVAHRIICLPWDIEWEITKNMKRETRTNTLSVLGVEQTLNNRELARKIGSKAPSGKSSKGKIKPAYVFSKIASNLTKSELSEWIVLCFHFLLKNADAPHFSKLVYREPSRL